MNESKKAIAPRVLVNWLAAELPTPEGQRLYAQERCIVAVTEAVTRAHQEANLSKADVAKRIGRSRAHVSRLLSGERNMTLRSLADLLWAASSEVSDVKLSPLGVMCVPVEVVDMSAATSTLGSFVARATQATVADAHAALPLVVKKYRPHAAETRAETSSSRVSIVAEDADYAFAGQ